MQSPGLNGLLNFIIDLLKQSISLEGQTVEFLKQIIFFLVLFFFQNLLELLHKKSVIFFFFPSLYLGRSHTKEFDESDGNSWTHVVPSKEPFTGIFSSQSFVHVKIGNYPDWKDKFFSCLFLQKYRLGKSQQSENCSDDKQEGSLIASDCIINAFIILYPLFVFGIDILYFLLSDYKEIQGSDGHFNREINDGSQSEINE